jgi:hypothetical protein
MLRVISNPTLRQNQFALARFDAVAEPAFQELHRRTYGGLRPGENATNQLPRGIRWGVYAHGHFVWLDRIDYSLPATFNPEEEGKVRRFSRIPDEYLRSETVESMLRAVFEMWEFKEASSERAYEVQLSAIRYQPSLDTPALPSPIAPHRDMVDGAIVVLAKTEHLVGGSSRLYTLQGEPQYEVDLGVGDALLIRDAHWLHQVAPILLSPGNSWTPSQSAFRDVLLIRFAPLGR